MARPVAQLRAGRRDWYRIENLVDRAEVWLYDEIGYLGVTAADFVRELNTLAVQRIDLHINSPGGEVFDGIAIYQALKDHPAAVHVQVDGLAASAASFIAMAGDRVVMTRNATMMIHDGHGLCVGNAQDMRDLADLLDRTSDNIADIYAQKAGGEVADWRERMRAETWYTAEEAVKAKLADEIKGVSAEAQNSWDLSVFNYAGREQAPPPGVDLTGPGPLDGVTLVDVGHQPDQGWPTPEMIGRVLLSSLAVDG